MNRVNRFLAAILLGFCLTLPTGVMAADLKGQLVVSGSDTMEPMVVELAKGFMGNNKGVKVIVRGSGAGKGVADTLSGSAAIGMVSRALSHEEAVELRAFPIAYDGICFVTSKKNPVLTLTPTQLHGIFTGKIHNWKQVGGHDLPVSPMIRYRNSSSNRVVADYLGVRDADLKGTVIDDADEGVKLTSRDPKAIYFVSSGEAFHDKVSGVPINILAISGKRANLKTIARNAYPLTRPLSFITKGDPSPLAKAFIDYCQSRTAAHTIRAHSFVVPE